MTEKQKIETNVTRHLPNKTNDNAVVLRVPKPNLQVIVLGLIAAITIFQTFQLVAINARASSTKVSTTPAAESTTNSGSSGAGSNSNAPQSMVGGC